MTAAAERDPTAETLEQDQLTRAQHQAAELPTYPPESHAPIDRLSDPAEAIKRCPYLASLPTEQAGAMLELIAIGQQEQAHTTPTPKPTTFETVTKPTAIKQTPVKAPLVAAERDPKPLPQATNTVEPIVSTVPEDLRSVIVTEAQQTQAAPEASVEPLIVPPATRKTPPVVAKTKTIYSKPKSPVLAMRPIAPPQKTITATAAIAQPKPTTKPRLKAVSITEPAPKPEKIAVPSIPLHNIRKSEHESPIPELIEAVQPAQPEPLQPNETAAIEAPLPQVAPSHTETLPQNTSLEPNETPITKYIETTPRQELSVEDEQEHIAEVVEQIEAITQIEAPAASPQEHTPPQPTVEVTEAVKAVIKQLPESLETITPEHVDEIVVSFLVAVNHPQPHKALEQLKNTKQIQLVLTEIQQLSHVLTPAYKEGEFLRQKLAASHHTITANLHSLLGILALTFAQQQKST